MRRRVHPLLMLVFCLCSATSSACKSKSDGIDAPTPLSEVSDQEASAFAKELEEALRVCDQDWLGRRVDLDSMMRRAVLASGVARSRQKRVLGELRSGEKRLREALCDASEAAPRAHFLRLRKEARGKELLFRFAAQDSLNYWSLSVGKARSGLVSVDGITIYRSGQSITESFAQSIEAMHSAAGREEEIAAIAAIAAREPAEAMRRIQALPLEHAESKPVQLLVVEAASHLEDALYQRAADHYRTLFLDDPALELASMDGLIMSKNTERALLVMHRLDQAVGGDTYLDAVRAGLLLEAGRNLAQATELAERALLAAPEDEDAHYLLLAVHVANRNFAGAVSIMRLMGERFELVFEEKGLDPGDEGYVALRASPEWAAYRAAFR